MSILDKVKDFGTEIKTHWNTPAEGKYVPYKEYKDVVIGVGANYTGAKTLEYIGFWSSCFLIMHHYKLPYLTFSVIGLLNMPLGYITALIWWYVCDNLGFLPKKQERKVYLVYGLMMAFGISTLLFDYSRLFDQSGSFITMLNSFEGMNATACFKTFGTHFLYSGWVGARNIFWRKKLIPKYGRYKYGLYCDVIPKCIMVILVGWLPVYNIPDVATRVWVANLLFATYNVFGFGNVLEECSKRISPNLQERILIRSYPVKLSHIFNSILAIILPAIVGMLRLTLFNLQGTVAHHKVSLLILAHPKAFVKNFFHLFSNSFSLASFSLAAPRRSDIIAFIATVVKYIFHFFSIFFAHPITCVITGRKPQNIRAPIAIHQPSLGKMHISPAAMIAPPHTPHFPAG